ncbi:MAG: PKD domain-containing protein [Chloroflexota bacterium]|nr:PKD domain-containing protein [Chloroflexota bacterium]
MSHTLRLASGASIKLPLGLLVVALLSTVALLLSNSSLSVPWERAPISSSGLTDYYAPASSSDALTWRISNGDGQRFQASFTPSGVLALPESEASTAWDWRMTLTAYGYSDDMRPPASSSLSASENRIQYQRGALTEWYKNTPRGLEQGFTISEPPAASAGNAGPLRLELSTSGSLVGSLSEQGDSVTFASPDGAALLRYDNLYAFDANGMELPSWMTYEAGRLSIFVDDSYAVYPITIDPIIATETRLNASDPTASKVLGASVARDGAWLIAGAWGDSQRGPSAGAAYIFENTGAAWVQRAKLAASDGVGGDFFGYAVAISRTVAVVGAKGRGDRGFWSGAAYVYRWNGTSWIQEAKLVPADVQANDQFGQAVAINGDTIVVGAVGQNRAAGAAYVFRYDGATWTQEAQLVASPTTAGDSFGVALAMNGNTVVVGAQGRSSLAGAAYVFRRTGSVWSQEAMLVAGDGASGDMFGGAVAANGNTAVIGAPFADAAGQDSGAAYVFSGNGGSWTQEAKLVPVDAAAADIFGYSVAVEGDMAAVGSVNDDDKGLNSGSVYLFQRSSGVWIEQGKLTASDGRAADEFGHAVAIQSNSLFVGAYLADGAALADTGAVYVYVFSIVANQPPTASAGGPYTVRAGASITLTGSATDPNGDPMTYAWDLDNDGVFETPGKTVTFSTIGKELGAYTVSFRACDPSRACAISTTTVNVVANNPPTANAGGPYTVPEGATVRLTGSGSDSDGDPVTFQWDLNANTVFETPPVPSSTVKTAVFPLAGETPGIGLHGVRLQVCDIYGACTVAETVVTITEAPPLAALAYSLLGIGKKNSVRVGVQATISGGLVGGNGKVDLGNRSTVGDVIAGGDVSVDARATAGNITAGGKVRVQRDAVTGTVIENATVPVVTLPAVNANPDNSKNIKRKQKDVKAAPLDLAPGRYGKLDSAEQDRIVLHGGEYHFSSVSIDAKSKITVDLSNGSPLVVRIAGDLKLGMKVQMEAVGGSASDIVFLVDGKSLRLEHDGTYLGAFVAPNGRIVVGEGATLIGSAWGKRVWTVHGSAVTWMAFSHPELLGPAQALQAGAYDDGDWEDEDEDEDEDA